MTKTDELLSCFHLVASGAEHVSKIPSRGSDAEYQALWMAFADGEAETVNRVLSPLIRGSQSRYENRDRQLVATAIADSALDAYRLSLLLEHNDWSAMVGRYVFSVDRRVRGSKKAPGDSGGIDPEGEGED